MVSRPSNAGWWRPVVAVTGGLALAVAGGAPSAAAAAEEDLFHNFRNLAPITIHDDDPASPYPSTVVVAGEPGTINEAGVIIRGLTHTSPDDIDMMLVSPAGTRVMLHSDAGGDADVSALYYGIVDSQVTDGFVHIPDTTAITNRFYLPADHGTGLEVMPPPAPAGVYYTSTRAFAGESPNGTWSLYVRDDAAGGAGIIADGWELDLDINDSHAVTTIPGTGTAGTAVPYPSTITIPDNAAYGRISKLRVVLSGVSHARPDDIDVFLRGPDARTVLLMSDAGGLDSLTSATFTFQDGAPAMPDSSLLPSGTYRPTNYGEGDTFPHPAPAGPYGSTLSQWNNTRPNGDWSLWVVDDLEGEIGGVVGTLGNWALEITTVEKGDFNRDATADLLWRHDTAGQNVLWYMEGATLFTGELTDPPVLTDVRWKMVGTHDFNGDGRTDILWRHATSGENVMWFMDKNTLVGGTFTSPSALADVNWQMAATGDFNGDARPDILWRHDVSGQIVAWFMNGNTLVSGTFTNPPSFPDTRWKVVGTGHFDPGVPLDILWWNQVTGQLVIWYMSGVDLILMDSTSPDGVADTRWRPVATGDYNRDGRVDIVWRHQDSGQNAVWFMGGSSGNQMTGGVLTDPPVLADTRWKIVGPR